MKISKILGTCFFLSLMFSTMNSFAAKLEVPDDNFNSADVEELTLTPGNSYSFKFVAKNNKKIKKVILHVPAQEFSAQSRIRCDFKAGYAYINGLRVAVEGNLRGHASLEALQNAGVCD